MALTSVGFGLVVSLVFATGGVASPGAPQEATRLVIEVTEPKPSRQDLATAAIRELWPKERLDRADRLLLGEQPADFGSIRVALEKSAKELPPSGDAAGGTGTTVELLCHSDQAFDLVKTVLLVAFNTEARIGKLEMRLGAADEHPTILPLGSFFGEADEDAAAKWVHVTLRQGAREDDPRRIMFRRTEVLIGETPLRFESAAELAAAVAAGVETAAKDEATRFSVVPMLGVPCHRVATVLDALAEFARPVRVFPFSGGGFGTDIDALEDLDTARRAADLRRELGLKTAGLGLAVDRLAAWQFEDGAWHADSDDEDVGDVGLSGVALLAWARNGVTESDRDWSGRVQRALRNLGQEQRADGRFGARDRQAAYNHAIALTGSLEIARVSDRQRHAKRIESAVRWSVAGQMPGGAWSSTDPPETADLLTTAWMLHALAMARGFEFEVPTECFERARTWLADPAVRRQMARADTISGVAWLSARWHAGMVGDGDLRRDLRTLALSRPAWKPGSPECDPEAWYLGTTVLMAAHDLRAGWLAELRRVAVASQVSEGSEAGGWPALADGRSLSPVWSTALMTSIWAMLEESAQLGGK